MALSLLSYDCEKPLPRESLSAHADRIRAAIVHDLAQQQPIAGAWEFAWGPGLTTGNMMYAVRERATGRIAVAIRGTDWEFLKDWMEDLEVLRLVPFPYVGDPDARIAHGTSLGLLDLVSMMGPAFPADGSGPTAPMGLLQFLHQEAAARPGLPVAVTGHSLGGALASVLAPWIAAQAASWTGAPLQVRCCTFAASTAGNGAFARATAPLYGAAPSRYFNEFDVVPRAWSQVDSIGKLFPGGPACPWELRDACALVAKLIEPHDYAQPTAGWMLPTPVDPALSFFAEVGHQHAAQTYLAAMTGASVERTVRVRVQAPAAPAAPARTDA